MIQEGRRRFLRFVGTSVAAAPVAVKEAASAMGLVNSVGSGRMLGGEAPVGSLGVNACPSIADPLWKASEVARLKSQIASLLTSEARERARREAMGSTFVLDPDIASMRSISPSVARALQVERVITRRIEGEKGWMEREIARLIVMS